MLLTQEIPLRNVSFSRNGITVGGERVTCTRFISKHIVNHEKGPIANQFDDTSIVCLNQGTEKQLKVKTRDLYFVRVGITPTKPMVGRLSFCGGSSRCYQRIDTPAAFTLDYRSRGKSLLCV